MDSGDQEFKYTPFAIPEPNFEPNIAHDVEDKCWFFTEPIPSLPSNKAHYCSEYLPFIPYLFYSKPFKNRFQGKMVYINHYKGSRGPLTVTLGTNEQPLFSAFGLSLPKQDGDKARDPYKYQLSVSLEHDSCELKFFNELHKKTRNVCEHRIGEWFTNRVALEARTLCNPMVKPAKVAEGKAMPDKPFPPSMHGNVYTGGPRATEVYERGDKDEHGNWILKRVSPFKLVKNCRVIAYAEIGPIWFIQNCSCSVTFTALIILPNQKIERVRDYSNLGFSVENMIVDESFNNPEYEAEMQRMIVEEQRNRSAPSGSGDAQNAFNKRPQQNGRRPQGQPLQQIQQYPQSANQNGPAYYDEFVDDRDMQMDMADQYEDDQQYSRQNSARYQQQAPSNLRAPMPSSGRNTPRMASQHQGTSRLI